MRENLPRLSDLNGNVGLHASEGQREHSARSIKGKHLTTTVAAEPVADIQSHELSAE